MAGETKVTRIKATDTPKASAKTEKKPVKAPKQKKQSSSRNPLLRALFAIGGYFKGAWFELKQVRWPTRRATWGLTGAVLVFSGFFIGLIVLLDLAFNSLFEFIIK